MPKPDIPTGGRLYHFRQAWQNITTDQWTQSVIRSGFRIQFRVRPKLTRYSSVFEEISYRSREDSTPSAGGRIYAGKSCHRTSLFTSSKGRLLQPDFLGSEEVRRMETGDRSVQTESVHPISSLQNGNHRLSSSYPTEERLGRFTGLERCIFPYCHPSPVQEVSPCPFYGENIPVSGSPVWAFSSTLRFHQSSENCGKTLSSTGNAITCIPGRLAATVNLPVTVLSTAGSVTANGFEPGICSQLGQIRAYTQSDILFSGSSLRSGEGYDRPFTRQHIEIANTYLENVGISFSVCPGDTFLTRADGIYGPPITRWQGSQTITAMACERSLVSGKSVLGLPYSIGSLVQARSTAVAEQGFSFCYGSPSSTSTRFVSVYGCKSDRLG